MQMPPNQQQSLPQATDSALSAAQQPQAKPAPQKEPKPNEQGKFKEQAGGEIMKVLEQHLNTLPPQQKAFVAGCLQHYPNIVIPFIGIVAGKEVFDYFVNIYKNYFQNNPQSQPGQNPQQPGQLPQQAPHPATGQQNSAPAQQQPMPNQGAPQMAPAQQPQQ